MDLLWVSLKGEEGGDDDGEEAQGHLDGIAFNEALEWELAGNHCAAIVSNAFVFEGVQGECGSPGVWHAFVIRVVEVKGVGGVFAEVASFIDLSVGVVGEGETILTEFGAFDVTGNVGALFATSWAVSAGLFFGIETWCAIAAGSGNSVTLSAVINGSCNASLVFFHSLTESASSDVLANTIFDDGGVSAGLAFGGISAFFAAITAWLA